MGHFPYLLDTFGDVSEEGPELIEDVFHPGAVESNSEGHASDCESEREKKIQLIVISTVPNVLQDHDPANPWR